MAHTRWAYCVGARGTRGEPAGGPALGAEATTWAGLGGPECNRASREPEFEDVATLLPGAINPVPNACGASLDVSHGGSRRPRPGAGHRSHGSTHLPARCTSWTLLAGPALVCPLSAQSTLGLPLPRSLLPGVLTLLLGASRLT